ncbi:DNA-binding protein [Lobosporangium transversale]|uniref:DNA-binding protein n=1 Tax=Lobosporangium transversale TaxID=64571 RepID=A0A1Y2GH48_9FUNG|nr:DNA-binding protein [Lobosporangium transversale]ORZ09394.1 DNA-binding protein [Lobosporangium transversale]|eukprot:XP_021878847.1 DNA-binding protein [Lobosporangium transversale]
MMQQQQMATSSRNQITLRGSTKIIVEFFEYCINSLLFQRGLYAPEYFKMTKKYGLNMLVTTDPQVKDHMREILKQVEAWLMACKVEKLILAIKSKETMTVLERWQFDIQNTKDSSNNNTMSAGQQQSFSTPSSSSMFNNVRSNENITDPTLPSSNKQKAEKTEKEIQAEIQAILRQITASVTFLPMLDEKCTWTILCQTEKDAEVPATWSDADPHLVHNAEQVKLRSFSTKLHRVDALVAYRLQDDL